METHRSCLALDEDDFPLKGKPGACSEAQQFLGQDFQRLLYRRFKAGIFALNPAASPEGSLT